MNRELKPLFQVNDKVRIVGKYASDYEVPVIVTGVNIWQDKIDYTITDVDAAVIDGWADKDFELVSRPTEDRQQAVIAVMREALLSVIEQQKATAKANGADLTATMIIAQNVLQQVEEIEK